MKEIIVTEENELKRLDIYLTNILDESRNFILKNIKNGNILVNDIKSTTYPCIILSIKLPIAPDNIKEEHNMFNLSLKCVFMSYIKYIINPQVIAINNSTFPPKSQPHSKISGGSVPWRGRRDTADTCSCIK